MLWGQGGQTYRLGLLNHNGTQNRPCEKEVRNNTYMCNQRIAHQALLNDVDVNHQRPAYR